MADNAKPRQAPAPRNPLQRRRRAMMNRLLLIYVTMIGFGLMIAAVFAFQLSPSLVGACLTAAVAFVSTAWKWQSDREAQDLSDKVSEAEEQAFSKVPERIAKQIYEVEQSQESLEAVTMDLVKRVDDQIEHIQTGSLFNLYSKQIQQYQHQTRQRASSSFAFAIIAMFIGLAFVGLGAWRVLQKDVGATEVAAGSTISIIGGALCAYITKTFLEVHKLSLTQLNRYFRQPVVNETILTAQRLADLLDDPGQKGKAYHEIIHKVIDHLGQEQAAIAREPSSAALALSRRGRKATTVSDETRGVDASEAKRAGPTEGDVA